MEWECEKCTLRNEPDALKCTLCEADRPEHFPSGGSLDTPQTPQTPGIFLPPTAGRGTAGSTLLPPQGTQNFGSGTLPPQGTLSPNAMADLMPSPPSRQRAPHSPEAEMPFGEGLQSYGQMSPADSSVGKKPKKAKKAKDSKALPDNTVKNELASQDLQQDLGRQVLPDFIQKEEHIPTYFPIGASPGPMQGSLTGSKVLLRILRAYDLRNTDLGILPSDASDPFAIARIGSKDVKTHVVENSRGLRIPKL